MRLEDTIGKKIKSPLSDCSRTVPSCGWRRPAEMTLELRPRLRRRCQPNEEVRQERTRPRRQKVQRWSKADLFRHIQEVGVAKVSRGSEGEGEEDPAVGRRLMLRALKTVVKSMNCIPSVMESLWELSRGATWSDLRSKKQP